MAKVLVFAGSLRRESYNKKLAAVAAESIRKAGGEATLIDLKDYTLPLFDEDIETNNPPANARKLKDLFLQHNALLLACPEYNSSITGVLKNVIDWVSRPVPGETPLGCFAGKLVVLVAASPGALGGLRGLVTVRSILGNIKAIVLPEQLAINKAHEAFDAAGKLKDPAQQAAVDAIAKTLVDLTDKVHGRK